MVQAAAGVMVVGGGGIFLVPTLVPTDCLSTTVYLSIPGEYVHPFITTEYPSWDRYFQQDNVPWHKAQIILKLVEFTSPQSPNLNSIEHIWDVVEVEICIMDVQLTKLQQLHNNLISIFFRIPKECFQHLVKSICHKELRHLWRQLGVQTSTRKVCLVSVQTINKAVIWSVEFCWSVFRFLYSRQICCLVHWNAQVRWRS